MKIITKKYVSQEGTLCREILSVPRWKNGTLEYQKGSAHVQSHGSLYSKSIGHIGDLLPGRRFTETEWQERLPFIKEAHARYVACEKQRQRDIEKWKGEEIFVF